MDYRIVFVDDEPRVLQGLKRMLRSMRKKWTMHFCPGASEALEILEREPVDIVVSDMRMPGMDGAEFLTEVMTRFPTVARLALSGQADEETIMRSVRPVHQYLSKPCDAQVLKATIQRLCSLHGLLQSDHLKGLVAQMKSIPSLPSLYTQIINELESENPSIKTVGAIIARDVGMTAKILQMVNSAFFGLRRRVSDPTHAVNLLGVDTVKNLVLSVHVFSSSKAAKLPFSLGALWNHSMTVGMLAKRLARAETAQPTVIEDALGAGMLHDLGKLILAANLPEKYEQVSTLAEQEGIELLKAEQEVVGTTHAELGAYLLGLWGLPDSVVEALAFHHAPQGDSSTGFRPLTAVHAANALDHELRPSSSALPTSKIDAAYIEQLGLAGRLSAWRGLCPAEIEVAGLDNDQDAGSHIDEDTEPGGHEKAA
ncbi:MAG: HDOD domain-containing protein [Candidatus Eisenbacteria sp.]|nr:HDOD domain-containing protein [Candidatus Eisenbacteria bacterium]